VIGSPCNSISNKDGGVLIAVDSKLKRKVLNVSIKCVEHIFVQLNLDPTIFILSCVYILNRLPVKLCNNFFSALNEL